MLLGHFERLRPICPTCRANGLESPLHLDVIDVQNDRDIRAGILGCRSCGSEYPILDGLPIIVPYLRRYVQESLFYLLTRDDLPATVESVLGDAAGPNTALDSVRQHLSSYAWDHWGDHDPEEVPAPEGPAPGAVVEAVRCALTMLPDDLPPGPVLDLGCGGGRSTVELARQTGRDVLGIDLSAPLARLSRYAVVDRRVSYPRRRIGLAYDRRRFALEHGLPGEAMDVWICDALALPFAARSFALIAGFNVIDCMSDPRVGIAEIERVLCHQGAAVLSTPFDWSANVTPFESWVGGHSQRGPHGGSGEAMLDLLLSTTGSPDGGLQAIGAPRDMPWHLRLHDRSVMRYRTHAIAVRRSAARAQPA